MFFQVTLLGGYFYAHVLASRVSPLWRTRLHILFLLASLAFLPVIPAESWKPAGDQNPLPLILALLATTIGLPFLPVLSNAFVAILIAGAEVSPSSARFIGCMRLQSRLHARFAELPLSSNRHCPFESRPGYGRQDIAVRGSLHRRRVASPHDRQAVQSVPSKRLPADY
jgi:hypothetical protein